MVRHIVKRILLLIPILFGVTLILFMILYFIPASSLSWMQVYKGDALDSVFRFFNAGNTLIPQYIRYCYDIITKLHFGGTSAASRLLATGLKIRFRNTLMLLLSGVGATMLIGVPIGVYAAVHKNRFGDRVFSILSLFVSSIPAYAIAMVLTLVLCVYWRLLPILPVYTQPIAYILPAITISLGGIASVARMTRSSMLEVLDQPYITALRSKGLKERRVIWLHAFKNAVVPVVSVLSGLVTQLLCGTLVVEFFFNVPGLGTLLFKSVIERDHFAILGATIVMTLILSLTNTAADIVYALINPQMRLRYSVGGRKSRIKISDDAA